MPLDTAVAWSREDGGVEDSGRPDHGSTTGTTPSGQYVGRVAGEDTGAFEETGAERRAEADREGKAERRESARLSTGEEA
ncbi:MAG TPA: hypothetical protein VG164_05720 [Trebonia sp.]|nr:hypothetical protein [Trebonia sp.]